MEHILRVTNALGEAKVRPFDLFYCVGTPSFDLTSFSETKLDVFVAGSIDPAVPIELYYNVNGDPHVQQLTPGPFAQVVQYDGEMEFAYVVNGVGVTYDFYAVLDNHMLYDIPNLPNQMTYCTDSASLGVNVGGGIGPGPGSLLSGHLSGSKLDSALDKSLLGLTLPDLETICTADDFELYRRHYMLFVQYALSSGELEVALEYLVDALSIDHSADVYDVSLLLPWVADSLFFVGRSVDVDAHLTYGCLRLPVLQSGGYDALRQTLLVRPNQSKQEGAKEAVPVKRADATFPDRK
jgi:hypothetical protein